MTNPVGVVIGRFQIPTLHKGHIAILNYLTDHYFRKMILVGIRDTPPTETNPLSYEMRYNMIHGQFPNIIIAPCEDSSSDAVWSENVDKLIYNTFGDVRAELICGRDGFKEHYHGEHTVKQLQFLDYADISATKIRERVSALPQHETAFRDGVIYALGNLMHRIYLTVDIALFRNVGEVIAPAGSEEILIARKPDENAWRLPGGFVNPGESFEQAAKRELLEETGLNAEHGLKYVGDFNLKDWRIRDAKNVSHKTILMQGVYAWGAPVAKDDVAEVKWARCSLIGNVIPIVEEHKVLFDALNLKEEI